MGFLGGIGKALGGVIKQVAPMVLKAVAPAATKMLQQLTSGFIDGGAKALKGLVGGLPSPISSILNKLIDGGAEKLKGLTGKALEEGIAKLVGLPRAVPGAPAGTAPQVLPGATTPERAAGNSRMTATAQTEIAQQQANLGSTNSRSAQGGTIEDKALAGIGGLTEPTFPGDKATEADLAKFQRDLGKYNRMFEMYSKIMANAHEMKKALISNIPRN